MSGATDEAAGVGVGAAAPLRQRLLAEFLGTALLLATVVGSGIMGVALSGGNDGIALLANAGATAAILFVLIVVLGPVSGAHFNPVVTLAARFDRGLGNREAAAYIALQLIGAVAGVLLAHAMFGQALWQPGEHARTGLGQWLSEAVATFGLVLVIQLGARCKPEAVAALVAAYIFAAYWFTASTSFANPAVTLARALTASFSGIRPGDVLAFVLAQGLGAAGGWATARGLVPAGRRRVRSSRG
ncbi:MAG TPA: MIP/aquaporin family protein [Luteimonas sp.]|nr:MIP/aquaporin family protein [Luteimonas sp.]